MAERGRTPLASRERECSTPPRISKVHSAASPANPSVPQIIDLVQEAMQSALRAEAQAADSGGACGPRPGSTIDLSRKGIQRLPDEVVDLMKNGLERLALSYNRISSLPARFSECTSLRYLNIRANRIKEFPMILCDLKSLEILDLGRNQLRILPPELVRLSSLKVLCISKNEIQQLPKCLGEMVSLQVLKFDGNPISFPPRHVLHASSNEGVGEVAITARIKNAMKQYSFHPFLAKGQDASAEATRLPQRRTSGRFPIRVHSSDVSDVPSSNSRSSPSPIPFIPHQRGLSHQDRPVRRAGMMPFTIGDPSDRPRSNSGPLVRLYRSESRNRRMGMVSKKGSNLGILGETEDEKGGFSPQQWLSYGSGLQVGGIKSPVMPPVQSNPPPVYIRRVSVIPERRRDSKIFDPVIECAKGVLYSVFQIHPIMQMLMTLLKEDESARVSSLEIVFYNTNSHVEELEQEIQKYDTATMDPDTHTTHPNGNVLRACQALIGAYSHVCTLLAGYIDTFVENGDGRYLRTLLLLLYNGVMELRVTCTHMNSEHKQKLSASIASANRGKAIRHDIREAYTPRPDGSQVSQSRRSAAAPHWDILDSSPSGNLDIAELTTLAPGKNFQPVDPQFSQNLSQDDVSFENILSCLQKSVDVVLEALPSFTVQLTRRLRNAMHQFVPAKPVQEWKELMARCEDTIEQAESMKKTLSMIKLRDPGAVQQEDFWSLCIKLIATWTELASHIMILATKNQLPSDTRARLKPIQQSMKETTNAVLRSPWQHLLKLSDTGAFVNSPRSSPSPTLITPQSAALGPAMQATMPQSSQNSLFAAAFQGDVFNRADALLANPGISMRPPSGTNSRGHSNVGSLSSISSMSSDGRMTPSSSISSHGATKASRYPARRTQNK